MQKLVEVLTGVLAKVAGSKWISDYRTDKRKKMSGLAVSKLTKKVSGLVIS